MASPLLTAEALVLRKSEYSESSLIFAAITEPCGRQDFILRGARRNNPKQFPVVDLFRIVQVEYRPAGNSGLANARNVDLIVSFDNIARNRNHFAAALWLSQLVLANSQMSMPMPELYRAVVTTFGRLAGTDPILIAPEILGVGLVLLREQGVLPLFHENPEQAANIASMCHYALGEGGNAPNYAPDTWNDLVRWMENFILHHTDISLPNGIPA